jgi:hypothetical protein
MENNIGYAVITVKEYKEIIEDIKNKEELIKKLNIINRKETERNRIYEKLFIDELIDSEEYHFEDMNECKVTDYHYQQIFNEFLKVGITDVEYIDLKIKEMKHYFENKEIPEENQK